MAQILPSAGQSLMAVYTVPNDFSKAWLLQMQSAIAAPNAQARAASMLLQTRAPGGAWQTKEFAELHSFGGANTIPYPLPVEFAAGTDFRVRAASVSGVNTIVTATFDLLLEE